MSNRTESSNASGVVHICDDNGERNFSVFLHLGEIFLHVMIADLREEHEEIFSC